jgi:hypothetical protein
VRVVPKALPKTKIKKVAVVGAGFMGASASPMSRPSSGHSGRAGRPRPGIRRQGQGTFEGLDRRRQHRQGPRHRGRGERSSAVPHHADADYAAILGWLRPRHRGRIRGFRKVKKAVDGKGEAVLKRRTPSSPPTPRPCRSPVLRRTRSARRQVHRHPLLLAGRQDDAGGGHPRQEDGRQGAGHCARLRRGRSRRRRSSSTTRAASTSTAACFATWPKPMRC